MMSEDRDNTETDSTLPINSSAEISSEQGRDEPRQNKENNRHTAWDADLGDQLVLNRTSVSEDVRPSSCLHVEDDIAFLDQIIVNDTETDPSKSIDSVERETGGEVNIYDLPPEVVQHIWSYFTLAELCLYISPVCRWWRGLVLDPIHWQTVTWSHPSSKSLCKFLRRATLLKTLNLYQHREVTLKEATTLATNCPQLQKLELTFCDNVNKGHIKILADNCKNLQHINLEGCRLIDDACMRSLARLSKLRSVNLSHCIFVTTEGIEVLAKGLPWLERLNIDGIPDIKDSAVFTLVLHHGDHLVSLELDGAELTDAALQAIARCLGLTSLTVSFAELMTDVALSFLRELRTLQTLCVKKGADFTNGGLSDLFTVSTLTSLTILDLSECAQLLDSGIRSIVKCCGKSLEALHLRWCWNVTDDGLSAIIEGCPRMKVLDLLGLDRIRGHAIERIPVSMPQLCLLDLQQCNKFIDELVTDVVQGLPKLIVYNYYGERFQLTSDGVITI